MNKQTENTIQNTPPTGGVQSEPPVPVVAGGLTRPASGELTGNDRQPPATAGGSDPGDIALLRAENEQLKASIRTAAAHRQITGELGRAGARSPELLFDSIRADLQFAEDGAVGNSAALLERLKRSFPEQFGFERPTSSIDGGAGIAAVPQLTKEALAKMKPAEIAELDWADVKRVLAQ